jgi:hypothetical protein
VVAAIGATSSVFVLARPSANSGRTMMPAPPAYTPPYSHVAYSLRDVRRTFAAAGIRLVLHGRSPAGATLSTADARLEVDVFGAPGTLVHEGFHDVQYVGTRWVATPRRCTRGVPDAARWRGNVRAVVRCVGARRAADAVLRRAAVALARL